MRVDSLIPRWKWDDGCVTQRDGPKTKGAKERRQPREESVIFVSPHQRDDTKANINEPRNVYGHVHSLHFQINRITWAPPQQPFRPLRWKNVCCFFSSFLDWIRRHVFFLSENVIPIVSNIIGFLILFNVFLARKEWKEILNLRVARIAIYPPFNYLTGSSCDISGVCVFPWFVGGLWRNGSSP